MRCLSSKSIIIRFRVASFLVIFSALALLPAVGTLAYGIVINDVGLIVFSGGAFGGIMLLMFINMLTTSSLRCPLCMAPVLRNRRCSKHRGCKRIFGSHRLKVAQSILFSGYFVCPYCSEKTVMKARVKSR